MSAYAQASPFLAFFIALAALFTIRFVVGRTYRCIMVMTRGWPPAHLDADGDWEPRKDDEGNA